MKKVTDTYEFYEIEGISQSGQISDGNYKLTIRFKDGGVRYKHGEKALKFYKQLCRNKSGEHLD